MDGESAVQQYLENVANAPAYKSVAWRTVMVGVLVQLADAMHKHGMQKSHSHVPESEFLRHVRNAIAHGGRFHFVGSEPKHPAKVRHIAITADMQGASVWGVLGTGDSMDLLDDILISMRAGDL